MDADAADATVTMDFSELEGVLRPILADVAQDAPSSSGIDADQLTQRTLAKLWKLIRDSQEDRGGQFPGIPLPDVDAELLPLQQQVDAVLVRLNARRAAVPPLIEAATAAQLAAARGGADAADAGKGAPGDAEGEVDKPSDGAEGSMVAGGEGADVAARAEAGALLKRATATGDKLPAVRARLDEALHRLQTNLKVLGEGGEGRPSPRTVEKVMARAARAAEPLPVSGADQDPAPDAAADGESGADATRRCLARELA